MHTAKYAGLVRQPIAELCLNCHDNEKVKNKQNVHQPVAEGKCLSCHAAHTSDAANLLPTDLSKACFSCHKNLAREYKIPHKPFAKGQCNACHEAHGSDNVQLLKKSPRRICQGCHSDSEIKNIHKFNIKIISCLSCHNPHGGNGKALLRKVLHPPFADGLKHSSKNGCEICHKPGKSTVGTGICLKCHKKLGRYYFRTHNHMMNKDGNSCTSCHSPHAGDDKMLLRASLKSVCERCHKDTADRHAGAKFRHKKMGNCITCHEPHGADGPAMLKGNGNTVCTVCHESQGTFSHPVGEKVIDVRNGQMMTCITCHDPKGTDFRYNLRLDGKEDLCRQCHNY